MRRIIITVVVIILIALLLALIILFILPPSKLSESALLASAYLSVHRSKRLTFDPSLSREKASNLAHLPLVF